MQHRIFPKLLLIRNCCLSGMNILKKQVYSRFISEQKHLSCLGNKTMTIEGNINFPKPIGKLPPDSCMRVAFADVSLADKDALIIADEFIDLTDIDIRQSYAYVLESKKPIGKSLSKIYTVAATVNMGWCPKPSADDWVRKNDYVTDVEHYVTLTETENSYKIDVNLVCYGKSYSTVI